ncbi:MAG: N-acetylmuramoyl-L-alanine amidase [Zetaproteobacteria bacterium CG12_big_fil_rev_8_21_14_0_65_54_13]|nr:MAG: N-acetylmuramoyl-L-alanine amidase [Zetaproteobacteria bacterium CG12_big_fil_rev_8_21_14_0_65_54_13]PIX55482.1 MAG: N-acetylmuramoyl-L-alanine amidase [Zetaproteobacteria bacterium CG_4_10_14_3_um_filter_54_28]PJA27413.1 MAG: N-acetylmuramoyl-L-alanine amidase [Zetaproteobacteria bacterium CG_4_9_14_3_um_filter_54_145]
MSFNRLMICAGVVLALLQAPAVWAGSSVKDIRLWTAPDHSRLVMDLSSNISYKLFRLHNPERIVIDMQHTTMKVSLNKLTLPDPVLTSIRHGNPEKGVLRLVLDVKEKVQPRSFLLKPMHGKPYRLVLDLMRPEQTQKDAVAASSRSKKGIVIAVDAGHGGEDPGAIGPRRLMEKEVTLAVAKKLAAAINREPGMSAVLTRKGDYVVALGQRVSLARKAHADMMISIHADAVRQRDVKGASVYMISDRGATQDRAARALAAKENAADEVGGVTPLDQVADPLVSRILGDMFRRDSLNSSQMLAEEMLHRLKKAGPIKYGAPKRARFVVLLAMEIPSVLVELDYISNPSQERKLRSSEHQDRLAAALLDASVGFFRKMGRLNTSVSMAPAVVIPYLPNKISHQGV